MELDFSLIIEPLLTLFGALLTGALLALAKKVFSWIGVKEQSEIRQYVLDAFEGYAHALVAKLVDETKGVEKVKITNAHVIEVANYALAQVPEGLRKLKVDEEGAKRLAEKSLASVIARL